MQMQPYEFAYDYLLRTNVMTADRLAEAEMAMSGMLSRSQEIQRIWEQQRKPVGTPRAL